MASHLLPLPSGFVAAMDVLSDLPASAVTHLVRKIEEMEHVLASTASIRSPKHSGSGTPSRPPCCTQVDAALSRLAGDATQTSVHSVYVSLADAADSAGPAATEAQLDSAVSALAHVYRRVWSSRTYTTLEYSSVLLTHAVTSMQSCRKRGRSE
jgi:hypothetical protein